MTAKKKNQEEYEKLEIGVKDFGPISSGSVALKPFTILIGPNNSGKSYFSMLLHSVFESFNILKNEELDFEFDFHFIKKYYIDKFKLKNIRREFPGLRQRINDLEKDDELEIPNAVIERFSHLIFNDIFEKRFGHELIRSYACKLRELIRNNKRTFSIKIDFNSSMIYLDLKKSELKIVKYPELDISIKVKRLDKRRKKKQLEKIGAFQVSADKIKFQRLGGFDIEDIFFECFDAVLDYIKNELYTRRNIAGNYLPAARSGILQGHKALVSNIVKQAPYAGIEKIDIPKFSGVVSDFLSSLLELSDEKGPLFDLTREFEKDIIRGEIAVKSVTDYMYPEIKYRFEDKEIPLHMSSSTVHELAPLFLYLKYKVEPGNILIIEEPEAHLHPENQRKLAKLLVRLIRKGVKLFITTHSDYLLDQLSSFIMLSQLKNQKQGRNLNYDKDDYLTPGEIGVYVFSLDKKADGYKIEEVEVSQEEGISQEEFLKVSEALYEESLMIQQDIQAEKHSDATS
jgi:predicted ATPase